MRKSVKIEYGPPIIRVGILGVSTPYKERKTDEKFSTKKEKIRLFPTRLEL